MHRRHGSIDVLSRRHLRDVDTQSGKLALMMRLIGPRSDVGDDERLHKIGMQKRRSHGHKAAHRMAEIEGRSLDLFVLKGDDIGDHCLHRMLVAPGRVAMIAVIDRINIVKGAQLFCMRRPVLARTEKAMQNNQRSAGALKATKGKLHTELRTGQVPISQRPIWCTAYASA